MFKNIWRTLIHTVKLRSTNIEELINQYSEQLELPKKKPLPKTAILQASKAAASLRAGITSSASPVRLRGTKRTSSEMAGSDKENNIHIDIDIDMPKKRTKTAAPGSSAATTGRGTRATSRKVDPSKVLSPKSHNSRQLPQSPFKAAPTSPGKSYLARPAISPAKPGSSITSASASLASLVAPAEKSKPTGRATKPAQPSSSVGTTGSLRGRRGAAATAMAPPPVPPKAGRGRAVSSSSDTSNGTVVTKKAPVAKKGMIGKMTSGIVTAAGKRAAAKKEIPAPSAAGNGGRVLRARR